MFVRGKNSGNSRKAFLEFPEFSTELELELEIVHAGRG